MPKSAKEEAPAIKKGKDSLTDKFGFGNPQGCCPGQTGHHLISHAAVAKGKNCSDSISNGPKIGTKVQDKYNYAAAPTACVTGSGHSSQQHGELHDTTDKYVQQMVDGEYGEEFSSCQTNFSLNCSIEAASQAHADQFSHCDKKCTKEQLEKYYEKMGCTTNPVNKSDKLITPTPKRNESGTVGG